jgi:nucleotide-binding universal stress UspA family protein
LIQQSEEHIMLAIRTILHPTDFSDSSDSAFRLACSLARSHGARLHVLHVGTHPVITPVEGIVPPEAERYHETLTDRLRAMRAEHPNLLMEHQLLFVGDPAGEILPVAQAINADLIVMGTHGRTGLRRLLMGSVAEQVVRRASCPVVTVKVPLAYSPPAPDSVSEAAGEAAGGTKG